MRGGGVGWGREGIRWCFEFGLRIGLQGTGRIVNPQTAGWFPLYIYTSIYVQVCIFVCIHVGTRMYLCRYLCTYVWILCICVSTHTYTNTHTRSQTHVHTIQHLDDKHTHTKPNTCTYYTAPRRQGVVIMPRYIEEVEQTLLKCGLPLCICVHEYIDFRVREKERTFFFFCERKHARARARGKGWTNSFTRYYFCVSISRIE